MTEESGGGAPQSATEVKEQAQEKVSGLASQAQSTAREQVDQRSTQAGEQVTSLAGDLRSVGEHLRTQQDNTTGAKVADQVADRAEKAGSYLTESDADRILGDIEDFGRRQPLLALAGGVVLGIAAARFLKASSSARYESYSSQASQGTTSPPPAPTASLPGQPVGSESVGAATPPPEAPAPAVAGAAPTTPA